MRKQSVLALFAVALLIPGCALFNGIGSGPTGAGSTRMFRKAIDAVYPALVRIEVVEPEFEDGREIRYEASGSGVIISAEGYVVTNHHVAGKATSIVCVLSNKEEIRAERVGTDPLADICVLKLTEKRVYPYARFGDSSKLKIGDTVFAMGSPEALSQSVTAGVVSNVDLILPAWLERWMEIDGENVGALVKWIAHDAAIYGGNSGGPLVNLAGEIVGVNELGLGLGAAIPGNLAKGVVDDIIRKGEPERSILGLLVQPLLKSSGRKDGVLVSGVIPGGGAELAGIQAGDIVLSYNDQPVTARVREDLPVFNRLVFDTPVGDTVKVLVERDGEKKTFTVETKLRTRVEADTHELKEWGMTAQDLTETTAKEMKRDTTDGVLVFNTRPGGPCLTAKPDIRGKDVIVSVGGKPIKNTEELIAKTAEIVKGQKDPVPTLVGFERKNEECLTVVKVGVRDLPDQSPEARKAWLPASCQVLTADLAEGLGLAGKAGVRLTDVFKERSAEKAGLKVGDIITAIDGDPVRASRPEDQDVFPAMVRQRRVGQAVELSVIRDGREIAFAVTLERSPKAKREMKRYRDADFGFTVRDLSDEDRRSDKLEQEAAGPTVSEVEWGSLAAVAGLRSNDLVLSVDGTPTPTVATLKKAMAELQEKKPKRTVFFVKRGIYTMFVEADTPWVDEKK